MKWKIKVHVINMHLYGATLSCHNRLRNDLYCVEWDVKPYYTIPLSCHKHHTWRWALQGRHMRSLSAQLLSQCVQPSWHQLTRTVCVCTDTSKYETELSQVVGLAYTSCSNCTRPPFLECRCQWPGIVNAPLLGLSQMLGCGRLLTDA